MKFCNLKIEFFKFSAQKGLMNIFLHINLNKEYLCQSQLTLKPIFNRYKKAAGGKY